VAILPDGRFFVSASHDRTVKVWEMTESRPVRSLAGHKGRVQKVVVTPDGRHALSGSLDGSLKLWDLESGTELHSWAEPSRGIAALALSPDGRHALAGGTDGKLTLLTLDASSAAEPSGRAYRKDHPPRPGIVDVWQGVQTWAESSCSVGALAMTPDGKYALAGYTDGSLQLLDIRSGEHRLSFRGHSDWI